MICALFCLNVAPKKELKMEKQNISRGFERFRERKHPKTCPWDGGLRKPLGHQGEVSRLGAWPERKFGGKLPDLMEAYETVCCESFL